MGRYDDRIAGLSKTLSYWPADDPSGQLRDLVGGRPTSVVGAGVGYGLAGPVRSSRAISGNGAGAGQNNISVPHTVAFVSSAIEAECWRYTPAAGQRSVHMYKQLGAGAHGYSLRIYANGSVELSLITTGGTFIAASPPGIVPGGQWSMVSLSLALAAGLGSAIAYVNGVAAVIVLTSGTMTNNAGVMSLVYSAGADDLAAPACRFAVYSSNLTNAERVGNYKAGTEEPVASVRKRPRRQLAWALCNRAGNVLEEITQRTKGEVEIELNGARRAACGISLEDPAAAKAVAFASRLKVWLSGAIIFNGLLTAPKWGEDHAVEIAAVDPSAQLAYGYTKALAKASQVDQSQIIWDLIAHKSARDVVMGDPYGSGIIRGLTPASYLRDRFYPDGAQIWEAIVALSEISNGVDFELQPLDRTDGVCAQLNTYFPWQGADRSGSVVLAYNTQEMNASAFTHEPGQITTYAVFGGQAQEGSPAPGWIAWDPAAIPSQGVWEHFESLPDTRYTAQLREYAEGLVATRSMPVDFFDVTPVVEAGGTAQAWTRDANGLYTQQDGDHFSIPPPFGPLESGGAYWIGDQIRAIAREGTMERDLVGRVTYAKITEVGEHLDALAVELSCAPNVYGRSVSGVATTVTTEDFS